MNYGLYLSASGVLTNLYRQDVYANNLANVETAAFKPQVPTLRQRAPESVEDPAGLGVSQRLLDRLGGGVLAGRDHVSFEPGPMQRTGNPLDVALDDDHSFFVVRYTDPATGDAGFRLTRDGRFTLNSDGELVTQAGFTVLDPSGNPIVIPPGSGAQFEATGELVADSGAVLGRVQVAAVADTGRLFKQGQGLFNYKGSDPRRIVEDPVVLPGHIEGSGVDPIQTLMNLTGAGKAASANADMIRFFDRMMEQAVTKLGRVA